MTNKGLPRYVPFKIENDGSVHGECNITMIFSQLAGKSGIFCVFVRKILMLTCKGVWWIRATDDTAHRGMDQSYL